MPERPIPNRQEEAVRARRAELRTRHAALTGGHRAELRTVLALSRVRAAAATTAALTALAADAAAHLDRADRAARRAFASRLAGAVDATAARLHDRWAAELRPGLLRIATTRALPVRTALPAAGPLALPPPRGAGSGSWRAAALAGALRGATLWRVLLLPLALLPVWGLPVWGLPVWGSPVWWSPALGGRALAPLAVGTGTAVVLVAARARCVRAQRQRLRRHADDVLGAAAVALDADLDRRLIELESVAAAALDAAARRARADVESELAALSAPAPAAPAPAAPVPTGAG